jgi:hypothetical protein
MGDDISVKQVKFIEALLTSIDIKTACKRSKTARSTLYQRMKDEAFVEALHKAKSKVIDDITTSYLAGLESAKVIMMRIMTNEIYDEAVRLRACNSWNDMWLKLNETANLIPRIELLEEAENERQKTSAKFGRR